MNDIEDALAHIPPDDREVWVAMGMAIKDALGESGFDVWDRWSQGSRRYQPAVMKGQWRSFRQRAGGITVRSLYHEAREHGWNGSATAQIDRRAISREEMEREASELRARRQRAAERAAEIKAAGVLDKHPYLLAKGFDREALVWENKLVVPMYDGTALRNVQLIDADGTKKFLPGGQAGGCEFVIAGPGPDILCEGYATGLSVEAALMALRMRRRIRVCFSANNMVRIARGLRRGVVVADNDESGTGERIAKEIGWPYWISDRVGEDFNDAHKRLGLFRLSQSLRSVMARPP